MSEDLLNTAQVARLTGYSQDYVRELLIEGAKNPGDPTLLHGQKVGRDWVITRAEVDRFIRESGRRKV